MADPLARALELAGFTHGRLDRRARRGGVDVGGAAGVSVRPAAHLLRDGARRPAAAVGGAHPSAHAHPVRRRRWSRGVRGAVVAGRRRGRDLRPDEHRHAVRVHAGLHRRPGAALQGAGSAAAVQGAVRLGRSPLSAAGLRLHHGRPAAQPRGSASASGCRSACSSTSSTASGTAGCANDSDAASSAFLRRADSRFTPATL